jgi:hypothetical protein
MGLNDGFIDRVACPNCGAEVLVRLQIKMPGVYMNDYAPGSPVSPEVLESVRRNEARCVEAMCKDFDLHADPKKLPLESGDGTFAVVGPAYRLESSCTCSEPEERLSCVAVVENGVFKELTSDLPDNGPIVNEMGVVFPRWMLQHDKLRSYLQDALKRFCGDLPDAEV